ISDDGAIDSVVTDVLAENTEHFEQYKNGKTNMFDYFVGQVMKKTRGQANPVKVKETLTNELSKR
ncbi:MAG: Asp-tRNA(Asn)/Glu-tRNA(Gln) amidotransferase GatCAB subunit B, partial [Bacilli bacterium]|nr:Asp-tRNA(Asn)/Glu-tRNA(Gln) amidotransferase GatCAB subunit B [Bacilli bacterium]